MEPRSLSAKDNSGWFGAVRCQQVGIVVLVLFLAAGMIYSALLPSAARFPDEDEYLKLSTSLVYGPGFSMDGVHLTASRAPGYAFFLAGLRLVGGGSFLFRGAQFLLLGATILLVVKLVPASRNFASLLIATGLVICYPVLFYTSSTLYPQTLAAFLFIAALSFLLASAGNAIKFLGAGISFGILILVVPTFLLTLPVVLGVAWILKIVHWRDAALVVLVAGLVVGVWTLRNAVYLDHFVPVASNSGLNFLEGNNPNAMAEAAANVGMQPYYEHAWKLGLDEFQCDQFYRQAAFAWIEAHPGDAFLLYLEKVANFFNVRNVYSSEIAAEVPVWKQAVLAAGYILLLGLLAWRLAGTKHLPLTPRDKLFLAVYVLSAFTSAIFFTRIRHRLPYDYLIIAVIVPYLSYRVERWINGRKESL